MSEKAYMDFPQPRLSVCQTVGGYFRVEIHGPDQLRDNQVYSIMDIGRGATEEEALAQAWAWYNGMEGRTVDD